ncbi:unnamed protein product [Sphenostylis stenocarpa]|uniref:Uncharacterized protein n=1 Tax=Sphenostylis stenocarpa TaxID=92480 RepID=A0AA86T4N8_9FABA|nr:unnamed protein product [Sphenostylis stenocarpa]
MPPPPPRVSSNPTLLLTTTTTVSLTTIATMNVQEDAAKHIKGRDAREHASHVATDATVCPLEPTAIRRFVLVMHASRLMGISLSALEIIQYPHSNLYIISMYEE